MKEFRIRFPDALGLLAISPRQQLLAFTHQGAPPLKPGWELLALHPKPADTDTAIEVEASTPFGPGKELVGDELLLPREAAADH